MIKKVLIANRGEIAVRIIRACRNMGILSVAIYSKEDKDSLHIKLADQSICIGEGPARNSYLNKESIITAALNVGADAIHPGYGFLSENSEFVKMCEENGINFIGPTAKVIDRMGNKSQARKTMMDAGVPVVPGTKEPIYDVESGMKAAENIGYPVMVKASSGGGGKGMRVVKDRNGFEFLFNVAQRESINAFGDDTMYIEKFIEDPRHIEIQVIADNFGNVVALGERDCSVQRNHQKLVEESPSPAISPEIREALNKYAILAAKAVNYTNAGTIEFIMGADGSYYFMEMNTRIQVEHPITEMITNVDLVQQQIKIAAGEELPFTQEDISFSGHAIECRLNAENPFEGFRPSPGKVTFLHQPVGGMGVRIESALYTGYQIPPFYDSMLTKLIAHGKTREEAILRMKRMLFELVVEGVDTNQEFVEDLLDSSAFKRGDYTTAYVESQFLKHWNQPKEN